MTKADFFPIVGLGASAGGIQALEGFFKGLPEPGRMAFVVVTHLSPERVSKLHEVIARYTDMPVEVAEDGKAVSPGRVYVMPENAILTIESGVLRLRRPNALERERKPIDIFFSTLAKDRSEYGAGVVLSGGDGDGTLGVKAIKEYGGLTLAQVADGYGPRHPDMPDTAIGSGLIDLALPVEEIGPRLVEFARSLTAVDSLTSDHEKVETELRDAREKICTILKKQAGHDFSGYKIKTFLRRVHRRMHVVQVASIKSYIEYLETEPKEVASLFRDLLINVTSFFRDAESFELLERTVVPRLFEGKSAGDTIRAWIPACATGEEAFSLAILLREQIERTAAPPRIQIFATDIDERALGVARSGRYPAPLLEGVSADRKQRFFTSDGTSFVVRKEIRDLCIFSPHSVIKDPPFSRIDLVSCRNLLIYFGPDIQNQVIPIFHYSLKPGGYLFLGTSESISQHGHLFATIDKKNRIFKSREHASDRLRLPVGRDGLRIDPPGQKRAGPRSASSALALRQQVETQILDRFAPAHVVVDQDGDVVYYSARTGKYLEAPQGMPNQHLLTLAKKGLRLALRSALSESRETRRTAIRERVHIDDGEDRVQAVTVTVEPLAGPGGGEALTLVLFADAGPPLNRVDANSLGASAEDVGRLELERELRDTRERLQSTIEEYETALEELKSSNEELMSVNEEAQSTNEELEASKEEMQSLNEELTTINAELYEKVEELARANADLRNFFASTQIATIFLDRNLTIRSFTPATTAFFKLIPSDAGRPLTDLAGQLDYPNLNGDIQAVLGSGNLMERRILHDEGRMQYLARLLPYRGDDEEIHGVVATFVDITNLARAEAHQDVLIQELNHRVKNMLAVVISVSSRTRERAESLDAYHDALVGRLHSMASAYELLARETWKSLPLEGLIRQQLRDFGGDRVSIGGDPVRLDPKRTLAMGLVIHELTTNAAKYGALSAGAGRIEVRWHVDPSTDVLRFSWQECDGPAIDARDHARGFGLKLVYGEIGYSLGGTVDVDFAPNGLRIDLSFDLADHPRAAR